MQPQEEASPDPDRCIRIHYSLCEHLNTVVQLLTCCDLGAAREYVRCTANRCKHETVLQLQDPSSETTGNISRDFKQIGKLGVNDSN